MDGANDNDGCVIWEVMIQIYMHVYFYVFLSRCLLILLAILVTHLFKFPFWIYQERFSPAPQNSFLDMLNCLRSRVLAINFNSDTIL